MAKYVLFSVLLYFFVSCSVNRLNPNYPKELSDDSYLWENRLSALKHYQIDLNAYSEYYLIEEFVAYNKGHWGCFYLNASTHCFVRADLLDSIQYEQFEFNELILNSLKSGKMDTLWTLSTSFEHKIISPTTYLLLTKYKNNEINKFKMPSFKSEPEKFPDNY